MDSNITDEKGGGILHHKDPGDYHHPHRLHKHHIHHSNPPGRQDLSSSCSSGENVADRRGKRDALKATIDDAKEKMNEKVRRHHRREESGAEV